MSNKFTRRDFLKYSLATGVVIWAGNQIPTLLGMGQSEVEALFTINPASAGTPPTFPQSVASGDPQPNGIVLWTRIAPQPTAATVAFQISTDSNFGSVTLNGTANTDATRDYTVKVAVPSGLQPFTTYYYRFIYNNVVSNTGRFKTLPDPTANVTQVRFAYITCQDYSNGFFNAFSFLANEDIDFVVHLGDYIYEQVYGSLRPIPPLPSGGTKAQTLADYRYLYQTYKADAALQLVHERFAFIIIWDDHEFANDCYKQYSTDNQTNEFQNRNPARRQAGNQAWAEYTPATPVFDPNRGSPYSIQIYRSFVFGNLMELVMTDERLYRDGPPCGLVEQGQRYFVPVPGCAQLSSDSRTMLGTTQKQWFLNKITQSTRTWKIWGNEVMTMQFKVLAPFANALLGVPVDVYFSLDEWDGYPKERTAIFQTLKDANVKNFITLTGDLHTYVVGYQRVNFDSPLAPGAYPSDAIGVEFVVGSITSSNFAEQSATPPAQISFAATQSNPHFQYFDSFNHGYNLVTVTPTDLTVTLKGVSTIKTQGGTISTLKTYRVPKDQVLIQNIP